MNWRGFAVAAAIILITAMQAFAKDVPATETQPAAVIDPKAQQILREATTYLAGIKAFRVTDHASTTMVIDGAPKQRQSVATLAMERPDRFALRDEGLVGQTTVCDGQNLYTYRPRTRRYSVEEVTAASLEKLKSKMAWAGIGGSSAVSMLIADQPYEAFIRLPGTVTYAGTESIDGIACNRLHLTASFINIDIWIRSGAQPLPIKIVSTSSGEGAPRPLKAAQMETVNILQDWWLGEDLPEETFHFDPPAGAVKVARDELASPPPLHLLVGKMAPGVTFDLLDGGKRRLSDHWDKYVVVLTFCDPEYPTCTGYLPKLAEVAQSLQGEDVKFYVIIPAESRQAMQEFLARTPLEIPVALDPRGRLTEEYKAMNVIPTDVVIDRQGKVQAVDMGAGRGTGERLAIQIRAVLAGKDLAAEAIATEQKKPSPQTQAVKAGRPEKKAFQTYGAKRIWSAAGWFQDVAASARTGEIYALAKEGPKVVILDRRGRPQRDVPLTGNPDSLRIGNLVADEQPEMVLFRKHESGITVVDAAGHELWRHDSGQKVNDVWLADLNGDGLDETIISSSDKPGLEVLDSQGQLLWTLPDATMGVAVGVLDGDGQMAVVTSRLSMRIFDARGKRVREIKVIPLVEIMRVVPASQQRPSLILAAGLRARKPTAVLAAITLDGQQKWEVDLPARFIYTMAVAEDRQWAAMGTLLDGVVVVDLSTGQTISRIADEGARLAVIPSAEGEPILLTVGVGGLSAYSIAPVGKPVDNNG